MIRLPETSRERLAGRLPPPPSFLASSLFPPAPPPWAMWGAWQPPTPEEEEQVVESSLKAFKLCHCHGFARVDGILSDGTFHMLEINTIPGLTDLSDMPASALAAGMSFEQLIECIVSSAVS